MTEHLPECNYEKNPERNACICQRLRACEERMEQLLTETYKAYNEQQFNNGYDCGIDSAIDAVNRMSDTEAILISSLPVSEEDLMRLVSSLVSLTPKLEPLDCASRCLSCTS